LPFSSHGRGTFDGQAPVSVVNGAHLTTGSIFIPLSAVHRFAGPGKVRLDLIEVQSGPCLGEDDLARPGVSMYGIHSIRTEPPIHQWSEVSSRISADLGRDPEASRR
jgi:hypothetical protein